MDYPRSRIRWFRHSVQVAVLGLFAYVGWQFYFFILHYVNPSVPPGVRPPSVEAFLPIGGFMGTKYFLFTGMIEPVHPAGMIIFSAAVISAVIARKGFCSWLCPVGALSEYAWRIGKKLTGRTWTLPKWADYTLMSPKYLIMGAFFFVIGIAMTPTMIVMFFIQDYYKSVDIKMLLFFLDPSTLALTVMIILTALSFFIKNFWCRYLCPYGALLGLFALLSPAKITRDADKCTNCNACTKACPSDINVAIKLKVNSPECTGCLSCVSSCPEKGALEVGFKNRLIRPGAFVAILLIVFFLPIALGMATDNWKSKIQEEEYKRLIPMLVTPDMKKKQNTIKHP